MSIKKELESIFDQLDLDKSTLDFIKQIQDKIEEVQKNNNEIISLKENLEETIYNLDKIIPDHLKEDSHDN